MAECSALDSDAAMQVFHRMVHDIYVMLEDGDRRVLREFDLTIAQYRTLRLLDKEVGQRLTDLSQRLLNDKSTVTRTIDRLVQQGLVERTDDPDDRRAQRVMLTPAGCHLRESTERAHLASLNRRLQALSDSERDQLFTLLDKLRASLHHDLSAASS